MTLEKRFGFVFNDARFYGIEVPGYKNQHGTDMAVFRAQDGEGQYWGQVGSLIELIENMDYFGFFNKQDE